MSSASGSAIAVRCTTLPGAAPHHESLRRLSLVKSNRSAFGSFRCMTETIWRSVFPSNCSGISKATAK